MYIFCCRRERLTGYAYQNQRQNYYNAKPHAFPSFIARPWFNLPVEDCAYSQCPVLNVNNNPELSLQAAYLSPDYPNVFYVGLACLTMPITKIISAKVGHFVSFLHHNHLPCRVELMKLLQ